MELSYEFIGRLCERYDWQYCGSYGEPGYKHSADATTPAVVLGDYWCRCDKEGKDERDRNILHTYETHWPKVFEKLETQGVEFEWYDEWLIDYDNDKAYRTVENSYSWMPTAIYTDSGDLLTPDDDIETWIEYMQNNPSRCLPETVYDSVALLEAGFEQWNGKYQNGWHEGMDDDPKKVTEQIRHSLTDVDIVVLLDESSQFYIGFSAWTRKQSDESE